MALFGIGKKKSGEEPAECCCGGVSAEAMAEAERARAGGARVKVLGSGCARCAQLEAAAAEALGELGMDAAIDHVTDYASIAAYGVMTTPALVIDGRVVSYGKVLKKDEVIALIRSAEDRSGG